VLVVKGIHHAPKHGRQEARHVAGDDDDAIRRGRRETRPKRDEGALEWTLIANDAHVPRGKRPAVGGDHHHDVVGDRANGFDRKLKQRPAMDELGEFVPAESRGPTTGEYDRTDRCARSGGAP